MRKLLLIAVVIAGISAVVLAGRAGGIGPREPFARNDDLTEEQETLIAGIRDKAITAAAAETREARRKIIHAARDEILSVLTDEQKERLEQWRPWKLWGRGRW